MFKYTHVEAFYQVVRSVEHLKSLDDVDPALKISSPVEYRGTVKLHGSNAGVACNGAGLVAQSRNRPLTLEDDNLGFAAFLSGTEQSEAVRAIEAEIRERHGIDDAAPVVLFGEWIGPGIQQGVATTLFPERQWVLFGVATADEEGERKLIDALPELGESYGPARIFSITDVGSWQLRIDFEDRESLDSAIEQCKEWVAEVEASCPWGRRFGVEGIGEGIVWIPVGEHWGNSDLYWKAKGEKHKKVKSRKSQMSVDPEIAGSIEEFIESSVTIDRLEQGLEYLAEMGLSIEMRSTGDFLRWVGQDVQRECAASLEASGLEWKQVGKAVSGRALAFFKQRVERV